MPEVKPFEAGGELYDVETLRLHRDIMIKLRNSALDTGQMEWAVCLSHNVAILAHFIKLMSDEPEHQIRG
jgi:hypothetical protein